MLDPVQCGEDAPVNRAAGELALAQPRADLAQRDHMGGDVFTIHAPAGADPGQFGHAEIPGPFAGQSGGGGAVMQTRNTPRAKAGFLFQLAFCRFNRGFAVMLIADHSGRQFDHALVDRRAQLFDQHQFLFSGGGDHEGGAAAGVAALHIFPAAAAAQLKKACGVEDFSVLRQGHGR